MDIFELPEDTLGIVCSFIEVEDFRNLLCTCKKAEEIADYNECWFNLYRIRYNVDTPKRNFTDWKKRMGIMKRREFEAWFWNISTEQIKGKISEYRTLFESLRLQYRDAKYRVDELRQCLSEVHEQYETYREYLRWKNSNNVIDHRFGWIQERPRMRNPAPTKKRRFSC
jgi:hypothetical protein